MRLLNQRFLDTIRYFNGLLQRQAHEPVILLRRRWRGETVTGVISDFSTQKVEIADLQNPLQKTSLPVYVGEVDYSQRLGRPHLKRFSVFCDGTELERAPSLRQLQGGTYFLYVAKGEATSSAEDEKVYVYLPFSPAGHTITYSYEEVCRCVDPESDIAFRPQAGECPICYGTGIVGGYDVYTCPAEYFGRQLLKPANTILIRVPITTQRVRVTDLGIVVETVNMSWTGPEPRLRDWDVIVRKVDAESFYGGRVERRYGESYLRYWVTEHQFSTVRQNSTFTEPEILHQKFRLQLIQPNHIIYSFPLD